MTIASGWVYKRSPNVMRTLSAVPPLGRRFTASDFWRAKFWQWQTVTPTYVDFSLKYYLSEPLANTVDGMTAWDGDMMLTLDVNQPNANLIEDLQSGLATYLTGFFGRIFTTEDIRGCSL